MPPTLLIPAVTEIRRLVAVYLERFGEGGPAPGQVVLVHGKHGAGKTHAIGHVIAQAATGRLRRGRHVRSLLQLYVKAEEDDLVGVYRRLMSQIQPSELRDLTRRFVGAVTGDAVVDGREQKIGDEVAVRLRDDPKLLYTLLEDYIVDESDVFELRDQAVGRVTNSSRDFRRAVSSLYRDDLGDLAYRWLVGQQLDAREARRLGVKGPIATSEAAKRGLQLLAALCARAGTALIVYLDQYEKLVLGPGGDLDPQAAGVLHSLVEALPHQDAMFVLCGNDTAFAALPSDLIQRFGYNVVEARGLDLGEAKALVYLYLHPTEEAKVRHEVSPASLEPFTPGGLLLAHLQSTGNPRQLLQLCSEAYRSIEDGERRIDEEVVRRAAEGGGAAVADPQDVLAEVRSLAVAHGFTITDHGRDGLELWAKGQRRLIVLLSQATHYYDEVVDVDDQLKLVRDLRASSPEVRPIFIVLGYYSTEVHRALDAAGIEVIPYRPGDFQRQVAKVLAEDRTPGFGGQASVASLQANLEELQQTIVQLRSERDTDARALAQGATALNQELDDADVATRWRSASTDWVVERRRLEERITEARSARAAGELGELERLRAHAERQRTILGVIVSTVITAVVAFAVYVYSGDFSRVNRLGGLAVTLVSIAVLPLVTWAYWGLLRYGPRAPMIFVRTGALRALSGPVTSVEDLRRLAYQLLPRRPPVRYLLSHNNPQIRYVATVTARGDETQRLIDALPGERCALVRRALAQRLGREEGAPGALVLALESATPEAAYIFETLTLGRAADIEHLHELVPQQLRTLDALATLQNLTPAARALVSQGKSRSWDVEQLDRALRSGLTMRYRETLRSLSMDQVRDCVKNISPFESGGLGTVDHLRCLAEVDRAFLGLLQILFLSELGLFVEPEA
jgi:hypothetical protein